MAQQHTTPDELQQALTENRHLRETIVALREALETVRHDTEKRSQEAVAGGNNEIAQLKATIQELRNRMERMAFDFNEKLAAEQVMQRDEVLHLQQTIQLLRAKLEERGK